MNKIYKVVWSKVKNCYVVVSEIAKNVITGGVKSAKIGSAPVARGLALGALMAFVITGSAMAESVSIEQNSSNDVCGLEKIGANNENLSDYEITVTNKGTGRVTGIWFDNKSTATLDNITIDSISEKGIAYGIRLDDQWVNSESREYGDVVTVEGIANITVSGDKDTEGIHGRYSKIAFEEGAAITVTSTNGNAYAVNMQGDPDGGTNAYDDSNIIFNGYTTKLIATSKTANATGIRVSGTDIGGVTFSGKEVHITANGETSATGVAVQYHSQATSTVDTDITIKADSVGEATGIKANLYGELQYVVDFNGNIDVTASGETAYGVKALNGAKVELGSAGKTVSVTAEGNSTTYGMSAEDGSTITIGGSAEVSAVSSDDKARALNVMDSNIVFKDDVEIDVTAKAAAIGARVQKTDVEKTAGVTFEGSADIVANSTGGGNAYGLFAKGSVTVGKANLNIEEAKIKATSTGGRADGIFLEYADVDVDGGLTITAKGTGAYKQNPNNADEKAVGVQGIAIRYSDVEFSSGVEINATATHEDAYAYGLNVLADSDLTPSNAAFDGNVIIDVDSAGCAFGAFVSGNKDQGISFNAGDVNITTDGVGKTVGLRVQYDSMAKADDDTNVVINATSVGNEAYGISTLYYSNGTGKVDFKGNVGVTAKGYSAYGLEANDASNVNLGSTNKTVSVVATGVGADGKAIAVSANNGSTVKIVAGSLTIGATSKNENQPASSLQAKDGAVVNVTADTANITGMVYAKGNGSRVNIEATKGSINGNVEAEKGASVVVTLKSNEASFTGATNVINAEKGVTLNLQQGATWYVTDDSTVSSVCGDNFKITKASNVGVNEEVTVTLDGKHADGMHDDFESTTTNIYGVDLVIREKNESGLGGTVTLNSDSDITVEGAHHAIHTNGNDVVNITTDKLTLVNGTGFDAIRAENGGKVNIDADDVALTSKVYTNGDGSIVDIAGVNNVLITSTNGSAINNASDGATIKIGDEGTKTVAITGATEGSREVYDGQGNFVNYNEDNRAVIYSKGTVNIIANEKVVINDTGVKTKAVSAYGDANVTIDGGKQTVINGEITADGYGPVMQSDGNVEHQDNRIADDINVVIKGKDIVVDASLEAEEGVFARGDSTGIDNAVIVVGDANTEKVTVRDVDTGLFAWNGGSKVEVNSDSLFISADGNLKDSGVGICAVNSSNAYNKLAIVDVNAGKTEITVNDGAFAYGIYANGKSNVDVAGNVDVVANGTSAFGVEADKSATVVLGDSNSTVTFDVNADELDYEGESRAEAIAARENNSVKVLGNMNATVNGRDWVSGVESEDGSVVELGNVTLNVSGSDSSEVSGINVARKGAVKVNGNLEATVTGGEWASGVEAYNGSNIDIGNGSSEVKLTATATGTESSDKNWGVSAFGILSVGQTKPIIADNEEDSEEAHGGSTVSINASKLTINATSSYGEAYGIYTADAGVVNIENSIDAEINGKVFATGKGSQVNFINSGDVNITESKEHGIAVNNGGKVDVAAKNVTIDSYKAAVWMEKNSGEESKSEVHITANGDVQLTSKDRFAINNESQNNGIVNVSGKDVTIIAEKMPAIKVGERVYSEGYNGIINVTGETIKIEGAAHDVIEDWEQRAFVVYAEGGNINLNATKEIKITDTAKVGGNAIGAYNAAVINVGNAAVEINGNVYANGEYSKVNIEATKGSINGNLEAEDNASVVVTLKSKEASFTGATKVTNAEKGVTLNLQQGATWNVTGDSTVSSVIGDNFNITRATSVKPEDEVTIILDGRHADGIKDDYESTKSTITGVDLVLHEDNGLNGNQTIISDSDVTLHSEGNGINVANGNYVTIEAAELTIDVTANYGQAYGIYAQDKGNVKANGAVNITATGYSAYGVEAVAGSTVEIGSSDKDVTFTITSTGVDSNLEDKEYPEAQAISAEGGSKVTVNANKLDIITTANSKVTGSLQARDNGSEITVKATDVDITGDIFAGEGAKVVINTTTFATEGIIGSEGVIDIITGDVAYGAGTQFYTEGSGAINLAGGNVSGVLNIAKGNVNLTGATFTVANLNDAIKGAGKLVVDGSGVLKTTADQVFTVGNAETVDVETLGKNGINDIAKEKVTFKSGSLSLSDDYSYDYLTSITDVMKGDNGNATKLVMTGTLKNATSINPDDIETDENNQLDVNDASNLGSDVHLDNVTVKTDNNLLIGGSASKDTPVEVDGVKATDSVANGFSADGLDLGNADGAIITGGKEVTLGGSNGNDKIVSSTVESTTLVVGTGGDEPNAKGTLNIGTNNDADYKHHGKVHVNHGSDLNAKGKTKITGGVELEGGNLNVDEKGHLEADIVVESKKGNGNNGNNGNGNGNNKDKDKVTITGKVTGNLKVKDKPEGHPSTMIHLGNENVAGKLHAETADLNGATLFLDPEEANSISDASMFTLKNAGSLNGNIVVGQNSVAAFGVSGADEVEEAFAKTGLTFGHDGDVDSVVYIAKAIDVANGSIIAKGALNQAPDSYTNGEVKFAANSVLMVDAEDVKVGPVIKGVKNVNIVQPDVQNNIVGAKLYIDDVNIDDAQKGTQYTIFEGLNSVGVNASWAAENISTNNQLIKFTDASIVNGKLELKADGVQKVNDVYKGEVVAGDVVDKAIDTDASSSDFFNSAVDQKVNANKASQVDGVNSSLAMNEVAGVTHTTYAVSNILTDAVADHMSLANGKEHDKDIWAHYVHTKEDVDGLEYDVHSTQYSAQYNGVVVGTDLYKEGKATVGAALTYVDGNINGSSVAARTENDAKYYGASVYGSIQNDDTAVIADVSYLHGEHDITQRNSGKVITGEPETDAFSVGVRVEKEAKAGIGKLVPYVGLRYMHLGTGNYTNSIGLAYDADDAELFLLPVGLKYSADIKNTNGWTMRPVVEFGYVWAFGDTDADQTVSLNGASNGFGYDVTDSGSYVGRFMLEAEKANISYALGYEYQKGDNVEADKWMVNVNWKF